MLTEAAGAGSTPDLSLLRKFVIPEFIFGSGARTLIGQYARNFGARKVLIVTDEGVRAAGWAGEAASDLDSVGLPYVFFDRVTPNPRASEVMAGAELYRREGCNLIVAIGGGSPIDCAKGIGIVSSNGRNIVTFEGIDRVTAPMPPLICVPTTGGSSADVSQFAIITNEPEQIKIAIISKALVPDLALIDPATLTTMSSYLTACTGFDALSHAFEAFVSVARSPITDLHALEAVRLIRSNLAGTIREPENIELRSQVMLGSLHAGMAFSNTSLGAMHAMAHSLGGMLDTPHGESNAILLEHVVAFNFPEVPERYRKVGEAMGLDVSAMSEKELKKGLMEALGKFRKEVGLSRGLRELGVTASLIPELARKALKDPCMVTNPRRPSRRDIEAIYEDSL